MINLAKQFYYHMKSWAKSGFKTVLFFQYANRRIICDLCDRETGKKRCPKCGCFLFLFCRLKSSDCWNWDNTLELEWKDENAVAIKSENKCLRNS